jgi:signal transduction histidine kinase
MSVSASRTCVLLLALALPLLSGYGRTTDSVVVPMLVNDGRTLVLQMPGISDFRGGFSASIVEGATTQVLASAFGLPLEPPRQTSEPTPYGAATVTSVTIRFEKEQLDLLFRMEKLEGVPALLVNAGIRNNRPTPIRLLSLSPLVFQGPLPVEPRDWLVTALGKVDDQTPVAASLTDIQGSSFSVHEYGGLYQSDGRGFLFGPVGVPTAYVDATFGVDQGGSLSFEVASEMDQVMVEAGETRWGQQVVLVFEPPQKALDRWTAWVVKTHGSRTEKGALSGWSSWRFHGLDICGDDLLREIEAVKNAPEQLRPMVMQIDSGYWRKSLVDGKVISQFPEPLSFYAKKIATTGAMPGLLVNYRNLDPYTNIEDRVRAAVQDGFTYLKVQRTGMKITPEDLLRKTTFEVKRSSFASIREAAGPDTYLLYNESRPDRATVGFMDANRTGREAERQDIRGAITDVLRSFHLNGRWFAVDNDYYYMGSDTANISEITGGWPMVRTWMSMVGLSCGNAITGDPWHQESFKPFWNNVGVMTPPAKERTEVIDLCKRTNWPRLVGHVRRPWGDMTVALLWNPGARERSFPLKFTEAGMDPTHRHAVWSFWENRYLGVTTGSWTTPKLEPSASQHLCFTDLDKNPGKPLLIGSSLHIYCGAAEIKNVISRRSSLEIELTDAGAYRGNLFIYSRWQPVLQSTTGCSVPFIAAAGENVWRIRISDRKYGAPQSIKLGLILPVTHQTWFWTLIALAAISLLVAVWRYLAWMKIQRENVLEHERTRIAMDLHDDLGGGLTEIAMLSEVAQQDIAQPEQATEHLKRIFRSSREMTQALDEIVWAVNPANDTLEKFIAFSGEFARELLEPAGIRCRLEMPEEIPPIELKSQTRHQLCMVLKESLNNIAKHACASEVRLRIDLTGRNLSIDIEDNGIGFDTSALLDKAGRHDGVENMRKRMLDIQGKFEIKSTLTKGTVTHLQVRI